MESIIMDLEKGRTSGDGMAAGEEEVELNGRKTEAEQPKSAIRVEQPLAVRRKDSTNRKCSTTSVNAALSSAPGLHSVYKRSEIGTRSLAPVVPKGELVPLKPRLVPTTHTQAMPEHKKNKQPKFIPLEPYPGAVNPIVPSAKGQIMPMGIRINKNNLDINVLVDQMSTMRTQEMGDVQQTENHKTPLTTSAKTEDIDALKKELQKVREERDYFQGQFKFQTQVNSELKNLLVASCGEDLQTHVNVLTEDKLQLARALLHTANNLTTHTEQIEFLAGQCEVWRSKFLASSVMVEELARWKADLTQKNQMLSESTKQLLHATHQIRDLQLEILKNLKFVARIRYLNLPAIDVISLSAENLNILQQMVLHAGVGMPEANLNVSSANSNPLCDAEKYAIQALKFISQPLMATDEAIRALFEQAQRPYGNTSSNAIEQSSAATASTQQSTT